MRFAVCLGGNAKDLAAVDQHFVKNLGSVWCVDHRKIDPRFVPNNLVAAHRITLVDALSTSYSQKVKLWTTEKLANALNVDLNLVNTFSKSSVDQSSEASMVWLAAKEAEVVIMIAFEETNKVMPSIFTENPTVSFVQIKVEATWGDISWKEIANFSSDSYVNLTKLVNSKLKKD
jgi:hypothetical protein